MRQKQQNCDPGVDCILNDFNSVVCGDAEALIKTDGRRTFASDSIGLHLHQTSSAS